jgi:hypothetical protein
MLAHKLHVVNKTELENQLSWYLEGVMNGLILSYRPYVINMTILCWCPACAYFHASRSTPLYHENYVELDAATYKIGISMKNWVGECPVYVDSVCFDLIIPWLVPGFVMVEVFFVSVWCVMAAGRRPPPWYYEFDTPNISANSWNHNMARCILVQN